MRSAPGVTGVKGKGPRGQPLERPGRVRNGRVSRGCVGKGEEGRGIGFRYISVWTDERERNKSVDEIKGLFIKLKYGLFILIKSPESFATRRDPVQRYSTEFPFVTEIRWIGGTKVKIRIFDLCADRSFSRVIFPRKYRVTHQINEHEILHHK